MKWQTLALPLLVFLATLAAPRLDAALVRIRLVAADDNGSAIQSAQVGEPFFVDAYVQDLRGAAAQGVFAAYLDVEYDAGAVVPTGPLAHTLDFINGASASLALPGRIDEAGGFSSSLVPTGANEMLLFRVPLRGVRAGEVQFLPNPADVRPHHDVLLFGLNFAIPTSEIEYVGTRLALRAALRGDINGDGSVDLADFRLLKDYFGRRDAPPGVDIDQDGVVGLSDFNLLKTNFGASSFPVPEPGGWLLGLSGVSAAWWRVRARKQTSRKLAVTKTSAGSPD